ncbi:MAG: anti-anti-sigma factor [Gammaproteobacteria bacterium]|jgi:anti-anti-sigma factor
MPVSAHPSNDGSEVTIRVEGRFDFSDHRQFRQIQEDFVDEDKACIIDMSGAEYMDSSALGMLLVLRESAGGNASQVRITNCREELRSILEIANFHKLFAIE